MLPSSRLVSMTLTEAANRGKLALLQGMKPFLLESKEQLCMLELHERHS